VLKEAREDIEGKVAVGEDDDRVSRLGEANVVVVFGPHGYVKELGDESLNGASARVSLKSRKHRWPDLSYRASGGRLRVVCGSRDGGARTAERGIDGGRGTRGSCDWARQRSDAGGRVCGEGAGIGVKVGSD
jgi:hypothetical protein